MKELRNQTKHEHRRRIIEEEIIYKRIIFRHKCLVTFLLLFHIIIIFTVFTTTLNNVLDSSEHLICSHAYIIKNFTYAFLNIILFLFLLYSINSRRTLVININYFEKTRIFLIFGMMMSFLITLFKFIPDFLCRNLVISLRDCIFLTNHIFIENFILY